MAQASFSPRVGNSLKRSKSVTYACFLAPALILYVLTVIIPFFQGIPYLSLIHI